MSSSVGGSGAGPSEDGGSAEWRRIYDRLEAQVEVLAAGLAQLEALNRILHEYGDARDNINLARLHQAELSRSRWEAACKELLPGDNPKLTELLESDLEDSRTCAALFDMENSELKIQLKELGTCVEISENTADHEKIARDLRAELRKLKQGYETLCANKDKTVSTLLAEKDFVRNKLRAVEKDKAVLLTIKEREGAQATEAIHNLQKSLEELQLAARNKDIEIRRLQEEALAAESKLLVAEGKLAEMHSLAKEEDIQKLKDQQLESRKRKCASLPSESIQIFVKIFLGEAFTLKVKTSDTIDSVKAKIQDKVVGLRPCDQFLGCDHKELKDCCTLAEYNIGKNSTLTVIPLRYYIHVYTTSSPGKIMTLMVERSDTIADVKAEILVKEGIPPSRQDLSFCKELLENSRTLVEYNTKMGSFLSLHVRPPHSSVSWTGRVIRREPVPLSSD